MARTNNLTNFLNDVATAIKTKLGDSTAIPAAQFDSKIMDIHTDGTYQTKSISITTNGNYTQLPDTGYDAMDQVEITVNVPIKQLQSKTVSVTSNGNVSLLPDSGYDGFNEVNLQVNVPTGGSGDVKLFETEQAMQADPNPSEGDLAVVYREEIQPVQEDSEFDSCTFPNTVVLDSAFSGNIYGEFRSTGSSRFDGNINMSSSRFRFTGYGESGQIRVQYESQDGITYTRTDGGEELQEFRTTIKWSVHYYWDDVIGNFMKIGRNIFEGMYEYKSNEYVMTKNQLNTTPDYVYETTFYGKNGVESGTLTTSVSNSFTDVNAEVYAKIQAQYDNMQPRVLTDQDKTIDKNIQIIPSRSDGTLLLDTSNVTNMYGMFNNCLSLTTIPLLDTSNVTNMYGMFNNCLSLTTIPLLDTRNVTNMSYMFYNCSSLTTIPLLDTRNVTNNMASMFSGCSNLTSIPLLDTRNVTSMASMFSSCSNLTSIPLLDTRNVTSMASMFSGCSNLTSIPLLDTRNVTNMGSMFRGCSNLTSIPLLDTRNVTNMGSMFSGCSNLTSIPLLDTSNVTNMSYMFYNCSSLNNESLNNILAMCANAAKITSNKTLIYISLTEEQATICQSLSNYQAFTNAGWTTGY